MLRDKEKQNTQIGGKVNIFKYYPSTKWIKEKFIWSRTQEKKCCHILRNIGKLLGYLHLSALKIYI